ncbi:MAG: hypothetical protein ABJ327_26575 [Litoreibacter sp.]
MSAVDYGLREILIVSRPSKDNTQNYNEKSHGRERGSWLTRAAQDMGYALFRAYRNV